MKKILLFTMLFSSILCEDKKEKIEIIEIKEYTAQNQLKPKNLKGISQNQIDQHWSLYEGYVAQSNELNKELAELRAQGKGSSQNYSDRRRRYGFEFNGMVLHELYFGNMANIKQKEPNAELKKAIETSFGSFQDWKNDFKNAGKTRGIGWAILYMDPENKSLINTFVADHEIGNISNFCPILVLDVWEHAYLIDYSVKERPEYIDAFFENINWPTVEKRYQECKGGKQVKRF